MWLMQPKLQLRYRCGDFKVCYTVVAIAVADLNLKPWHLHKKQKAKRVVTPMLKKLKNEKVKEVSQTQSGLIALELDNYFFKIKSSDT